MSELVSVTRRGDVAVITVDNPPVNALSPGVPEGIAAAVAELEKDDSLRGAVLIGAGRTFIAGADIREFGKITSGEKKRGIEFLSLLRALEDCSKPVVAALHGTAFGGGLEVAMACHYRVGVAGAQVGQPEVKLGLIPGAAGTQRLPRLAGVAKALEMCAEGNPVKAHAALEAGILDRIVAGDLLEGAVAFVKELLVRGEAPRRTRDLKAKLGDAATNAPLFEAARAQARKKMRGMEAPLAAIESVEAATRLPFDEGCKREAELFTRCLFSDQSKALIHVFFAEREVSKIPDVPKETPAEPIGRHADASGSPAAARPEIRRAAVVGAGTMGSGIAMTYANAGIPVLLKEAEQAALDRGLAAIGSNYAGSVKRGRFTQDAVEKRLALIEPTLSYDRFGEADIVVEAVFEGLELKKQVFAELDRVTSPGAILASNTSTLDIDEIARATSRPARVVGHHFFAPPNVMRLLEIVRGRETSKEVLSSSIALARRLGKVGVVVGNCRGFVGNRMYAAYQREAQFLVEEGAAVAEVDMALYNFGMAMGPLATGDLSGLDVGWRIRKEYRHLEPPGIRQPLVADRLCELGRYGQKTGRGWYRYDEKRTALPDPEVDAIVEETSRAAGIGRRAIEAGEIVERTIFALVNEGARILEERIALRAGDIDIIYVNGYGFPAYRGGPMWYADTLGLARVVARIRDFERRHGAIWRAAPLLEKLASEGATFAEHDRKLAAAGRA